MTFQQRNALFSALPLIGPWLRWSAAVSLARQNTPRAINLLALAYGSLQDSRVAEIALEAIQKIQGQARIDAVCLAWQQNRSSALAQIILEKGWIAEKPPLTRALIALKTNRLEVITRGSGELAKPLLELRQDRDAEIAQRAQQCLLNLTGRQIIDAICNLWVEGRDRRLEQIICQQQYTARSPIRVRVLTALKTKQPQLLHSTEPKNVIVLAQACEDIDVDITAQAEIAMQSLVNPASQQELCQLALQKDDPALLRTAVKGKYTPEDELQRVLFFFLTSQWERYEAVDFDHQRLRTVFETADAPMRERITRQVRLSGRTDFLSILTGQDEHTSLAAMTPSAYHALLQILPEHKEWSRLWSLALKTPLSWSMQAVRILSKNGWSPDNEEEAQLFRQLASLITEEALQDCEKMIASIPLAVQVARVRLTHGRINDVAFSPLRPTLALGASRRKVVLWDFQKAVVEQVLEGFNHSIGEVAYTRQGVLLAGERTVNDETSCAVYACRDGKPYPALSKVNSITAIEPVGETQALVALRNFSVALLELADAPKRIGSARFKFWPRSACVSLNQQYAALVHHGVTIVNLPSLEIAAQSTAWQRVAHCAAFLPDGRGIAVGMYNGDVVLLREKRLRVEKSSLVRHTGWVEGLATLNKHSYLISAGADGVIQLTDWNERRVAFTGGEIGAPITSLHISPDENFMAIGYSDASLSLWDLRAADLPGILEQPFAQATHLQLAALNALAESGKLALQPPEQMALQFARLALQFRFRFDIELELPPEIKAGEYDIEIE